MGRGLHWDPFAHWWGHKNGHNLSQKKRHSNRFLKKISKAEFFCKVIRHRKMKSWVYYVPLICASEQKSYHTRYEYSKSFSRPQLSSIFLPFKQIWLHFELCKKEKNKKKSDDMPMSCDWQPPKCESLTWICFSTSLL